jgi:hypothetical protein
MLSPPETVAWSMLFSALKSLHKGKFYRSTCSILLKKKKMADKGSPAQGRKKKGSQYAYEKTLQWSIMTHIANTKLPKF